MKHLSGSRRVSRLAILSSLLVVVLSAGCDSATEDVVEVVWYEGPAIVPDEWDVWAAMVEWTGLVRLESVPRSRGCPGNPAADPDS